MVAVVSTRPPNACTKVAVAAVLNQQRHKALDSDFLVDLLAGLPIKNQQQLRLSYLCRLTGNSPRSNTTVLCGQG